MSNGQFNFVLMCFMLVLQIFESTYTVGDRTQEYVIPLSPSGEIEVLKNGEIKLLSKGRYWSKKKNLIEFSFGRKEIWFLRDEPVWANYEPIKFYTSDGFEVKVSIRLTYKLTSRNLNQLLIEYPEGMKDIEPIVKNIVKDVIEKEGHKYSVEELYIQNEYEFFNNVKQKITNDKRLVDVEIVDFCRQAIIVPEFLEEELDIEKDYIIYQETTDNPNYYYDTRF